MTAAAQPSSRATAGSATSPAARGGAGIVVASTVGNAFGVTPTVTAVFGVFLVAIATEFQWPRAEVSGALAAVSVANMLASPIAGRLGDRWGARRTALGGSVALGLLILSLAFSPPYAPVFYLQCLLIGFAGALPSGMIYAKLIAEWFETRRGLWIGIAGGVGNGLGATFFPLLAGALLPALGWRHTFAVIALGILGIGVPLQWWLLREAPRAVAATHVDESSAFEGLETRAALRTLRFWLLVTAMPIGGGCLIGLFSMIVPVMIARGFSLDVATMVIAVFALVCTLWEPSVGFILDHTKRPRILTPFYWIGAAGVLLLLDAKSPGLLAASAVMLAIGLGAESSALSFLLSRYFGRRALGAISGIAFGVMLGAGALTMVLVNAAFDAGVGYRRAVLCLIPVLIWNGAALLFLGRYPFGETLRSATE